MPPAAFTLASASESIHIWDVQAIAASSSGDKPSPSALAQLVAPPHPTKTIKSHTQTVNALQWNHNNGVLASGSSDGTIALSGVADAKLVMRLPLGADPSQQSARIDPVTALAFSSGSRYLVSAGGLSAGGQQAAGGNSAVVTIHDLKKHDKSRRLLGHTAAVTALDFGASDQHVASCSVSGEIIVHNLALASLACKLVSPAVAAASAGGVALRDLQHSPHKKHMLGVCGDSGVVELWDVNTSALTATLRPPTAIGAAGSAPLPLSALRFSPTSSALFASVGLDKRLCFYDSNSRKCIRDITSDYPLSCVDYHSDGCTLVLGTTAGHLLLYDIRAAGKPTAKILGAHGAGVLAVKFTHPEREANVLAKNAAPARPGSSSSSASAPAPMYDAKATAFIDTTAPAPRGHDQARSRPAQQAHNATLPPSTLNNTTLNNTTHSMQNQTVPVGLGGGSGGSGDLFSPIKDSSLARGAAGASPFGLPSTRSAAARTAHAPGLAFMSPVAGGAAASDYSAAAASPGSGGGDSRGSAAQSQSHSQPPAHLTASAFPTAGAGAGGRPSQRSASPSPSPNQHSRGGGFDPQSSPFGQSAAASSAAAFALHAPPSPAAAAFPSAAARSAAAHSGSHSGTNSGINSGSHGGSAMQQLLASPQRRGGFAAADDSADGAQSGRFDDGGGMGSGSSSGSGGGVDGGLANDHQVSLLRSLLESSLYDLRSELRSQVSDLHVEMLKQFHQSQLEQARAMDAFTGRFEQMINEVKELRDEYKQLKHIY